MNEQTRFGFDVLGRYLCSTWTEATGNGGGPFDVVIVGAGMYGAYLAAKVYRDQPRKRILVLDAGGFALAEHVQNLGAIPLYPPPAILPADDPGHARDLLWGIPWRGNTATPGMAYCVGGRSLFHGGWFPRPTGTDLDAWPPAAARDLVAGLGAVESETGADRTDDMLYGPLQGGMRTLTEKAAANVATLDAATVADAPLAVQGAPPRAGLFGFDKFSSVPVLMEAVRDDRDRARDVDAYRRLFVVPRAHVTGLAHANGVVHAVDVAVDGRRQRLPVRPGCVVVLQAGTIESTRLAMASFRTPLMGRNLMAHTRSDFAVRVRRSAVQGLADVSETAALLVRGAVPAGRFHLQVTASTSRGGADALLFRVLHDLDRLDVLLRDVEPEWINVTVRGVGQMHGDRGPVHGDPRRSWIDLSPDTDEYGIPRARVNLEVGEDDLRVWRAMDAAAVDLATSFGNAPGDVEYRYGGRWHIEPFPADVPYPEWHNSLGASHHEAGTLWMGTDPATSVTDPTGRFHHLANAYACDQSIFPVVGSANPALTGLTLARRLAGVL